MPTTRLARIVCWLESFGFPSGVGGWSGRGDELDDVRPIGVHRRGTREFILTVTARTVPLSEPL